MLHLDGGGGNGEAEVFVNRQIAHGDRFILDIYTWQGFVLMQIEGAGNSLRNGVTGWRRGIWLVLRLSSRSGSCRRRSTPSAPPAAPAAFPTSGVLAMLGLLGSHCSRNSQRIWVVFTHVFHQIRLRCVGSVAETTGVEFGMFHGVCR